MLLGSKSWVTYWLRLYSSLQPTLSPGPFCAAQCPQLPPLKHIRQESHDTAPCPRSLRKTVSAVRLTVGRDQSSSAVLLGVLGSSPISLTSIEILNKISHLPSLSSPF